MSEDTPPVIPQIQSSNISKVAAALAKAQGEIVQPQKNKTVEVKDRDGKLLYTFDYADYNAIVEAVRAPLSKNGICFTHLIEIHDRELVLATRLVHSSGEYLESLYPLPRATDPKALGGSVTYGKRICLSAITGCVADDDVDADPVNTSSFGDKKPAPKVKTPEKKDPPATPKKPKAEARISVAQRARMHGIADSAGWDHDKIKNFILEAWEMKSTDELTDGKYNWLCETMPTMSFDQAMALLKKDKEE